MHLLGWDMDSREIIMASESLLPSVTFWNEISFPQKRAPHHERFTLQYHPADTELRGLPTAHQTCPDMFQLHQWALLRLKLQTLVPNQHEYHR